MNPLDRKLLRDLRRMRGQVLAIGMVIAMGVMMLVMMSGLVSSLTETRAAYYERYRLADIFAPVTRAPEAILARLASIDGVASVEGRVIGAGLVNPEGSDLPVQVRAVSLPDSGDPGLNDIYLTDGRRQDSHRRDEILLLRNFAQAWGLRPGDQLSVTLNGLRRTLRIAGLAESPEFLYTPAPSELVPDDARFAVIWMSHAAMAATFDMQGAINEVLLALSRGAKQAAVLAAVDRMLAPHGGSGAYPLADQVSNRFITEEIEGLSAAAVGVPPIFMAVAAFLLYIVISRMVHAERTEIGLMKAFGYSNTEVALHYLKMVMLIASGGALLGCILGIVAGRAMIQVYAAYYQFPFLVFQLEPSSFVAGIGVALAAAVSGGLLVLRQVFALTPASAMQAAAPQDFSRAGRFGGTLNRLLDQPTRMVWRRVSRQPGRMAGAVLGIACGMALSLSMLTMLAGFDRTIQLAFGVVDRSDITVTFIHPLSDTSLHELQRLPGVLQVQAMRTVSATLRHGLYSYRGAIEGIPAEASLYRAVDSNLAGIIMQPGGITLSRSLADWLHVAPGDTLTVEVRDAHQAVLQLPVTGIAESLLGSPAYMDLNALNRALREPHRVSGAYLSIDAMAAASIYRALRDLPSVAGVSRQADASLAFRKLMDSGAGAIRYVMGAIAFVITFGIVYNTARIAHAERAHDLASLRVLGFTRAEVAFVLLGELLVVTLAALPLGAILGFYLSFGIAAGFSTDLYQIPVVVDPGSHGFAILVVITAAVTSGWLVKRDIDRIDMVSALKTKE
ncbi:ABC transporter permease [Granulosicoccus sp. 3-233]|uniref:ABC transporter permease n=1 Tax=Granulosicoccus sp. 3-233 TaxID=3417969 RepID=UPI003D3520B2